MLVIRDDQRKALRRAKRQRFERRLVTFVTEDWALDHGHLSPAEIRDRVRRSWRRAVYYDLTSERQIYRFVNLCCYVGWDFEADSRYRWVVEELEAPGDRDRALDRIGRRLAEQAHRAAGFPE